MEAWQELQPTIDRIVPLAFETGLQALSPSERIVLLVWSYPAAINDGGHASFFYNSYGESAEETVQSLYQIGLPEYARLLDRAIGLFPEGHVPRDHEERNEALEALPESSAQVMRTLDDEFYALGDDRLMERLLAFWRESAA